VRSMKNYFHTKSAPHESGS